MQKEYFDTLKKTKKDNTKTPEFIIEDNKELLAKIEKSYTDLKALSEEKIIIVEQLYKQIEIFAKDLDIKISKAENEYKDSSIKDDDSQQDDYSYSNSAYAKKKSSDSSKLRKSTDPSKPRKTTVDPILMPIPEEFKNISQEEKYCICNGISFGTMVKCDNEKCQYQWFHADCLKLQKIPSETEEWLCPFCEKKNNKNK